MKKITLGIVFLVLVIGAYVVGKENSSFEPDLSIFKDTMVELTWLEVKDAAKNNAIVLFPIAVVEEHGPHLDLSPDIYITCLNCRMIKRELKKKGINCIIAPPYYWGINVSTGIYPGSFTVREETFKAVLSDGIRCLKNWGFTKVFCVNFHGDSVHSQVLDTSLREIRNNLGIDVYNIHQLNAAIENPPAFSPNRQGKYFPDYHAGADETATIWAFYPDKVRMDVAEKLEPQDRFNYPLGYVGDPASFKLEKGAGESLKVLAKLSALEVEAFLKQKDE